MSERQTYDSATILLLCIIGAVAVLGIVGLMFCFGLVAGGVL